jgi:hypothetical protein
MKIYIAGAYAARDVLREEKAFFEARGHTVTSTWLQGKRAITTGTVGTSPESSLQEVKQHAVDDLAQVAESDALVLYTAEAMVRLEPSLAGALLTSGGRHVETGYALATGIPVIVVGPQENIFQRGLALPAEHTFDVLRILNAVRLQNTAATARV